MAGQLPFKLTSPPDPLFPRYSARLGIGNTSLQETDEEETIDLQKRVSEVETSVRELQTSVRELQTRMTGVETQMRVLNDRVGGLESRMAGVERELSAMRKDLQNDIAEAVTRAFKENIYTIRSPDGELYQGSVQPPLDGMSIQSTALDGVT
ncbi:g9144 [Coccomyxa elongata]